MFMTKWSTKSIDISIFTSHIRGMLSTNNKKSREKSKRGTQNDLDFYELLTTLKKYI